MINLLVKLKEAKSRRFLFFDKSLFNSIEEITREQLSNLECSFNFEFPYKVKCLLLELGHGHINDLLIHGLDGIKPINIESECGSSFISFASDETGNYFLFSCESKNNENIYYFNHHSQKYSLICNDLEELIKVFIKSGFNISGYVSKHNTIESLTTENDNN